MEYKRRFLELIFIFIIFFHLLVFFFRSILDFFEFILELFLRQNSWKICSLVVNRQSFLVIDGSLLKSLLVWNRLDKIHESSLFISKPLLLHSSLDFSLDNGYKTIGFWILQSSFFSFWQEYPFVSFLNTASGKVINSQILRCQQSFLH